jgi:hypothetical protein
MNPVNYVRKIVYINEQLNGFASYSPTTSINSIPYVLSPYKSPLPTEKPRQFDRPDQAVRAEKC